MTITRQASIGSTIIKDSFKLSKNEDIGTISYDIEIKCVLDKKLSEYEKNNKKFTGDILKIKCITSGTRKLDVKESLEEYEEDSIDNIYDVSYSYIKKDVGTIVEIDDDCIVEGKSSEIINDKSGCAVTSKEYSVYLEGA
jgi:hypothetical protein